MRDHGVNQLQHTLPKGIWLNFDFDDSHPDLPVLYLQGGSIIPFGHPCQHVGEADPSDDLSVLVALNEHDKAKGVLYEDDGDGYEYTKGGYLLTTYVAEVQSSIVTLDAWGEDGEVLQIIMPSESEVLNLVSASEKKYKSRMGLEILAFPCNHLGSQESGTNTEIVEFACTRFKAEYPIFDKLSLPILVLVLMQMLAFMATPTCLHGLSASYVTARM